MECDLYQKQYVGKSNTSVNIRLNNHLKSVMKPVTISVERNFQERKDVPNKLAKFIVIEKLTNTNKSKVNLC